MVEKPQDDLEANAARLAAEVQEATANNRRRGAPRGGRILAAAGLFGVAAVGVGLLFYGGGAQGPTPPDTATPDAFQTGEGAPFGRLTMPATKRIVERDTTEAAALRARLAGLQAELDRLRNAPPPETPPVTSPDVDPAIEAQLAALQAEVDAMGKALQTAEEERERALSEKDRELAQMQAALDAAMLGGSPVGSDPALDQALARRRAAEELYQRRVSSGMIAFSGGAVDAATGALDAGTGGGAEGRKLSANEAFAREAGAPAEVERARLIVNPAHTVIQGTIIQAVLETFINSDLPGQIRAVVTEDVHAYDGSRILIPRGSKIIGRYSDNVELGQRRAMVIWTRIILPDDQTVDITAIGGDAIGQSGMTGRVNTHFGARFGSATLISLLSLAPTLGQDEDDGDDAREALNGAAENLTAATAGALGGALNRKPTITVRQGSRVTIMVDRDLEIF